MASPIGPARLQVYRDVNKLGATAESRILSVVHDETVYVAILRWDVAAPDVDPDVIVRSFRWAAEG